MKSFKKFMTMTAVSAMALTTLAGCGSSDSDKPATDNGDSIKWGVNYEQSGAAATYGTSHVEGIQLAVDEINAAGGVDVGGTKKQIALDIKDNKTDDTELPSVFNKLVENGNVVILGPAISTLTKQSYSLAEENKIPTLSASATSDDATLKADGSVQPYGYKICFSDSFQGNAVAKTALDKGYKKVLVYADNSSDYAKGLTKIFNEKFTAGGGEVIDTVNYTKGDKDFSSILTSIKNKEFDAIFVPGYYEEASLLIKQAREMGIDKPILGPDGFDSPKLKEVAGAEALNNVFFTTHFSLKESNETVTKFLDAYKTKYSKEPDTFAALGYDLAYFVKAAIEKSGSADSESINKAIAEYKDFTGVTGTFSMAEDHTPIKSIKLVELKDGEQASVTDVDVTK